MEISKNTCMHARAIVLGFEGNSTKSDQIVFAAGKDHQLRFNKDGTVTLNERVIGTDSEIFENILKFFNEQFR